MKITLPELKNELGTINSKLDIVKDYLNLKTQTKSYQKYSTGKHYSSIREKIVNFKFFTK